VSLGEVDDEAPRRRQRHERPRARVPQLLVHLGAPAPIASGPAGARPRRRRRRHNPRLRRRRPPVTQPRANYLRRRRHRRR